MQKKFAKCIKLGVALSLFVVMGCGAGSKPGWEYMMNMMDTPVVKAQGPEGMRLPVAGTVPRGFEPYPFTKDEGELAAARLSNPLKQTRKNFERGEFLFNTYCQVCHGTTGKGDGSIVPKFPRPPSLHSDKVRDWNDARIYHVITKGQNLMPQYATKIHPEDRWAVVLYIRALQRAVAPTDKDVELLKKALVKGEMP